MTLDYIIPFFIGSIPTTSATSIPAILVKGIKPYCTAPSIVDIPLNCQRGNTRYSIREPNSPIVPFSYGKKSTQCDILSVIGHTVVPPPPSMATPPLGRGEGGGLWGEERGMDPQINL